MDNIYEIINELCKSSGINITILCKEASIPRSLLSEFKAGRTKALSIDTLNKIANHFDVSVDYLMGKSNIKKPLVNGDEELTEYLEELKNRPEMRMLFKLSSGASKEDVEKAVKIIEALSNQ